MKSMRYQEQAVVIQTKDSEMLGIISMPAKDALIKPFAVLIITGGMQYRIGSHRQFTRMAREIAAAGYPTMRFDMPGLGDSTGLPVPFDQNVIHIAASIETLVQTSGIQKICLWGLCDGASASLLYINKTHDKRIAGLALLNPWISSEKSLARIHIKYYYPKRVLQADFWRKMLSGKIRSKAIIELIGSFRQMSKTIDFEEESIQNLMAKGWASFTGSILLMLSGKDFTAQEFKEYMLKDTVWSKAVNKKPAHQHELKDADHTCSKSNSHKMMVLKTVEWLKCLP